MVDDLMPACTFPLPGSQQDVATAYPGLRELQVLKDFGQNGIVASICARNLVDGTAQDYGYRATFDVVAERLKESLRGFCMPSDIKLVPVANGPGSTVVPCTVMEARPDPGGVLECDPDRGRFEPDSKQVVSAIARLRAERMCDVDGAPACASYAVCRLQEAGAQCHTDGDPTVTTAAGWCYVDPASNPDDDPSIVAKCPMDQRRVIRLVGPAGDLSADGATVIVACSVVE